MNYIGKLDHSYIVALGLHDIHLLQSSIQNRIERLDRLAQDETKTLPLRQFARKHITELRNLDHILFEALQY